MTRLVWFPVMSSLLVSSDLIVQVHVMDILCNYRDYKVLFIFKKKFTRATRPYLFATSDHVHRSMTNVDFLRLVPWGQGK